MKINLTTLSAAPEEKISFDYTIDLSQEEVNFEHPFPTPVRIVGEVFRRAEMLRLEGEIDARVTTKCARCLQKTEYDKTVPVSFMLATSLEDEDVDDIWVLSSDELELDEVFVPELLLDMEMAVLCSEDCRGLCSQCGANLNEGDCGCDRREVDPRLEKLREMLDSQN